MSILFSEVNMGGVVVKNRYSMAPMGYIEDVDGGISREQTAYLVERAKGGFGMIYPSAHTVTNKYDCLWSAGNYLFTYDHALKLKAAVDEVHRFGAKFAVQLSPGFGRVAAGPPGQTHHCSASENYAYYYPDVKCHALTVDEIHELVEAMNNGAKLAKMAGVDVIEIHAYGGYLIDQFMSKIWNRRNDEYGGSLENRLRFFKECTQAVRDAVGPNFPISVKYTPCHELDGGRTFEDEGIEIAKIIEGMGFAYMHLDNGSYEHWNLQIPAAYDKAGSQVYVAKRLRKEGIKLPFIIQGKLNDPAMAEQLIKDGTTDMIILGKQSLADPYYPAKVRSGHLEDINYCTACTECLNLNDMLNHHSYGCAINPHTCHESENFSLDAKTKRRILVIGGGPGGMNFAKLAAQAGHKVELWEKSSVLGGNINAAGGPDFKFDMKRYNENLQKQLYKSGANVILMKEATREAVDKFAPELVVVAAGAKPISLRIPGIETGAVVDAVDVLTKKAEVGEKAVVLGGGEVGCEAAAYLNRMGKDVTVVEMQDNILTAPMAHNGKSSLEMLLASTTVKFKTASRLIQVMPGKVKLSDASGEAVIDCDTLVLAVGFKSDKSLAESLKGADYKVFTIGDYNAPRKVWYAIHEGFHILRQLDQLMDA